MAQEVERGNFKVGAGHRQFLIAGPCVIKSEQLVLETAARTDVVLLIRRTVLSRALRLRFYSPCGPGLGGGIR